MSITTEIHTPNVRSIRKVTGVAGAYSYRVSVSYGNDAPVGMQFVSTSGQIYVVFPNGEQMRVGTAVRENLGDVLSPGWIRKFYA